MTATSPLTHTGKQMADLQTRIQFLEADKRVQDLLIVARDAEIERLRGAMKMILAWFESPHAGREVLLHAIVKVRAELEQK